MFKVGHWEKRDLPFLLVLHHRSLRTQQHSALINSIFLDFIFPSSIIVISKTLKRASWLIETVGKAVKWPGGPQTKNEAGEEKSNNVHWLFSSYLPHRLRMKTGLTVRFAPQRTWEYLEIWKFGRVASTRQAGFLILMLPSCVLSLFSTKSPRR